MKWIEKPAIGLLALLLLSGTALLAADGPDNSANDVPAESIQPDSAIEVPAAAPSACECCGRSERGERPERARGRENRPAVDSGCPMGCGRGTRQRQGQGQGRHQGRGSGNHALMQATWTLIDAHDAIERKIEEVPGGIRTVTTSTNPDLVPVIRQHVREMKELIESGGRIRGWDPLFAEIFNHTEAIAMVVEDIDGGVVVVETSEDEEVAKLIRAHAEKVLEFVQRGADAYRESTPLPDDYSPAGE